MPDAFAPGHVLVVALVALLVLGPTEIPKAVRALARVRRQVAQLRARLDEGLQSLLEVDEPDPGPHRAEVDSP